MKNLLAKLNFKLTKLHLFLILVSVLILSYLGFSVKEYFDGKGQVAEADSADKSPQDSEKKDKNFESMIADLEDVELFKASLLEMQEAKLEYIVVESKEDLKGY